MARPSLTVADLLRTRAFALSFLALVAVIMLGGYLSAEMKGSRLGFGLDDSWIHATIARNLASGDGWSFNRGELMSGSTAPLYTAMLAGWFALTGELIWGAKIIGILGLLISCLFIYLSAERLTEDRFAATAAGLLPLLCFPPLWSALVGMEITVHFGLCAAALWLFLRQKYQWMTVLLALTVWIRPESVLLLAIGWLALPLRRKRAAAIVAAVVLMPYFLMNLGLSGGLFPNTVRAKSGFFDNSWAKTETLQALGLYHIAHVFVIPLLAVLGGIHIWRRAWWVAAFAALQVLIVIGIGAGSVNFGRYMYSALPFMYLLAVLGIARVMEWLPKWKTGVRTAAVVLLILQAQRGYEMRQLHASTVENVNHMQVDLALLLNQITDPADTLATNDIGAIGYFSGRYLVDLVGLVTPQQSFDANIRSHRPVAVAIFDKWFPERSQSSVFAGDYEYFFGIGLTRNLVCGDSVMSIYARKDKLPELAMRLEQVDRGQR